MQTTSVNKACWLKCLAAASIIDISSPGLQMAREKSGCSEPGESLQIEIKSIRIIPSTSFRIQHCWNCISGMFWRCLIPTCMG